MSMLTPAARMLMAVITTIKLVGITAIDNCLFSRGTY
jgi:hypothetical protein